MDNERADVRGGDCARGRVIVFGTGSQEGFMALSLTLRNRVKLLQGRGFAVELACLAESEASEEIWKQEKSGWFGGRASGLDGMEHRVNGVCVGGVRSMDLLPTSTEYGPQRGRFRGRRPECKNPRILEA